MIVEYIRYRVPGPDGEKLIEAYTEAADSLFNSGHCLAYEVSRSVDEPEAITVRIEWDSADGHLQGFRGGPTFQTFFGLVKPFFNQIEEMRHYEVQTSKTAP